MKTSTQNQSFVGPRVLLECLGARCGGLGSFWDDFFTFWGGLEGSMGRLGASWGDLGASWGGPGAPLGDLGVVLRRPWISFWPS